MRTIVLTAVAALALAGTASAGGWATAGVNPPPPDDGMSAGGSWEPRITIRQHGTTPLDNVDPAVIITNRDTGERKRFAATPTGNPGEYQAKVVFPSGGEWAVGVYDGFTQYGAAKLHTFGTVGVTGGSAGDGGFSLAWTLSGSAVIALALGAMLLFARRRGPAPAAGQA